MPENAQVTRTYCRLCEVGCGLLAHTDDAGALVALRPDHDHPATNGFACNKGLLAAEVHNDPARLRRPLQRNGNAFTEVGWDTALAGIGSRLAEIIERDGPGAVGVYLGNPNAFNAMAGAGIMAFAAAIGTDRLFSSASQDCANKFATSELLYGAAQIHPIADLEHTELFVVIGSNPRVSKSSFLSVADPVRAMRDIRDRGGRVVFVNPRRTEPDIGETLMVRPDTDAYLLAAMLHEIGTSRGFRTGRLEGMVSGVEQVEEFVADYSPEVVAAVVGVPAEEIIELAHAFADANGASLHVSTGLNMGRQGVLAYWLAQMLLILTGNLDREGGNYFASRAIPAGANPMTSPMVDSPWGSYRATIGMPPGALIADMINSDDAPLKALIVVAGNPALSIGGGDRMRSALESLDLLVTIDLYRNATGELADYVLPATDQYEREDFNLFVQGVQAKPYVQWTEPASAPQGEQREEWRILGGILSAAGFTPFLDPTWEDPMPMLFDPMLASAGLSVDQLRSEGPVSLLPEEGPGDSVTRLGINIPLPLVPEGIRAAQERGREIFESLAAEPADVLKLITRRTPHMFNSAFANLERLQKRSGSNPLWMNVADAERLGLTEGDAVRVHNANGEVRAEVRIDSDLRAGVVAMTHGYGNEGTHGMPVAQRHPGVNVNALTPSGPGSFDPASGQAHLTGISVEVSAAGLG